MGPEIIVLAIGNELLDGRVVNTNLTWLGSRLKRLGYGIRRSYTVRDDLDEIRLILRAVLREDPVFVITCGGLGPTWDDMTLQGIAKALGRKLEVNELARKWVSKAIRGKMTSERLKMACLPQGATPLRNRIGTAPGVLIEEGLTLLISLPGVPEEFVGIVEHEVIPRIRKRLGARTTAESDLYVLGTPEANAAPIIQEVRKEIKGIYVKTHVTYSATKKRPIRIHLSYTGRDAPRKVKNGKMKLRAMLEAIGAVFLRGASDPRS